MKKLILAIFFLAVVPAMTLGQDRKQPYLPGWGYASFAAGGSSNGGDAFVYLGGGGEKMIYKGLGAGAEIGYIGPARSFNAGFGLLSLNGSYHFSNRQWSNKAVPFVTGGYSLGFRDGTVNLVNFGAGVSYWMGDRTGLRLEFRDHVNTSGPKTHLVGVRVGIAFR